MRNVNNKKVFFEFHFRETFRQKSEKFGILKSVEYRWIENIAVAVVRTLEHV